MYKIKKQNCLMQITVYTGDFSFQHDKFNISKFSLSFIGTISHHTLILNNGKNTYYFSIKTDVVIFFCNININCIILVI